MSAPRISVVLPVYNGAAYVARAVASILAQTQRDFELIAIDDGSTDDTTRILRAFDDRRLQVLQQENRGLPTTLNRALTLCRGEYIARQDHDDLSHPERLARQVAFMDAHPRCALLGTRADIHVDDQPTGRAHDHPLGNEALQFALLFDNPFVHSSVMLRRASLSPVGGYSSDPARQPEDFELWSRIARQHAVANLPERLVTYREVAGSLSRVSVRPFTHRLVRLSAENLAFRLGVEEPSADLTDLAALHHGAFELLSERPSLRRALTAMVQASRCIDPRGESAELARELALRRRWIIRQYALRSALAQRGLSRLRALRERLRDGRRELARARHMR